MPYNGLSWQFHSLLCSRVQPKQHTDNWYLQLDHLLAADKADDLCE